MKSKIVRGIINGGVLAAVAALGITVYQFGTKPIAENPQEENSAQVEETGLEEELSDGENAEDAAAAGDGRMQYRMRFLMEKTEMKQVCQELQKPEQMQTE